MKKLVLFMFPLAAFASGVSPQALLSDPVRAQDPSHMSFQHKVDSFPEYPIHYANTLLSTNGQCFLDRPCTNFTYVTYMRQCTPNYYDIIQTNKTAETWRLGEGLPIAHIRLTPLWSSMSSHKDIISGDDCEYMFSLADMAQLDLEPDGTWSLLNAVTNAPARELESVWESTGSFPSLSYFQDGWPDNVATNILCNRSRDVREHKTLTLAICTDHDADVTVGNWERSFTASDDIQVAQLSPETGSGAVTVATDPSATVYLRLIDRDFDMLTTVATPHNRPGDVIDGGVRDPERAQQQQGDLAQYAFQVAIANPTTVCVRARGQWDTALYEDLTRFRLVSDVVLHGVTLDRFEKGAGMEMIFPMGGMYPGCKFECYGTKIFPNRLLTIEELDAMYDKDKERIVEKYGDQMSWREGDNVAVWSVTYEARRVASGSSQETTAFTDPGSGASGLARTQMTTNTFEVVGTVHSGYHNIEEIKTEDVVFSCPTAESVDGNVLRFSTSSAGGVHRISATDVKGIVKTAAVSLSGGTASSRIVEYTADDPDTLHYRCTRAVVDALASAVNDGVLHSATAWDTTFQYYKWKCKRLPVLPVSSTAGSQGHRSMAALSPHTYYSAKHYNWWVEGIETYVSEDLSVTSVVKTTSSMVKLSDWALAHGFTSEEVAAANIDDIVVGRFTEGTVDDSCIPYLLAPSVASNYFGTASVPGWRAAQNQQGQGLPVLVTVGDDRRMCSWKPSSETDSWTDSYVSTYAGTDPNYQWEPSLSGLVSADTVQDVHDKIASISPSATSLMFARTYPGDSGLGVYLDDGDGSYILLSHHHYVGGGPSYVLGHEILKAWILANGDTPKVYVP